MFEKVIFVLAPQFSEQILPAKTDSLPRQQQPGSQSKLHLVHFIFIMKNKEIKIQVYDDILNHFSAYTKASEADMVSKLLGTNNTLYGTNNVIIDTTTGSNYLARGHLAPDANFIYNLEQVGLFVKKNHSLLSSHFKLLKITYLSLGGHLLLHECGSAVPVLQQRELEISGICSEEIRLKVNSGIVHKW